jgi:ABC-type sugar transport system substrate-binding protein
MHRSRLVLVPLAASVFAIAACGGGNNNGSASNAGGGVVNATPAAVTPPPTAAPAEIAVNAPLPKTPPKGKSILYLQCELPACARTVGGIQQGAAALGWKSQVQVYKNSDPGAGLQQALQRKPDYIAITGIPAAAMKPELAAAAKAGIPVLSCGTTDQPAADGYSVECGGTLEHDAEYLGRWAINDSGGKAKVVAVSIPQFSALGTITDWFKKNFKPMCSGCSFDELDVTVDDVGAGAVGQKIVGYLQSHPDVNYVLFTFADLSTGVAQTIKAAGLGDKVKLIGAVENASVVKGVQTGTYKAWTLSPNEYMGMVMVDAAARLSVGQKLSQQYENSVYYNPTWVLDAPQAAGQLGATNDTWPGPANFVGQFKKLWHVGS